MRFYDALQLDPSYLKQKIRDSQSGQERRKLMAAIPVRSILTVLFAIIVISPVGKIFGAQNSAMAVAMFCILLGLRFVDFGYCIKDSLVNLAIIFSLLLFAPSIAASTYLPLALLIHFSAFFTIIFMTSDRPEMGNSGIYTFAYIYLSGNPVTGDLLWKRALLTLIGYVLCAAILFAKHHQKNPEVRFWDKVTEFSFSNKKIQWFIQLALGVSIMLALGTFFNLQRMMWAAFACGSILGGFSFGAEEARERLFQRLIGTLAGSLVFFLVYQIMPQSLIPLLGPLGGICLGFCTKYRYKTASNCLGALFMATGMYGLNYSIFLRIFNNIVGVAFGYVFLVLFQKAADMCFSSNVLEGAEDAVM